MNYIKVIKVNFFKKYFDFKNFIILKFVIFLKFIQALFRSYNISPV